MTSGVSCQQRDTGGRSRRQYLLWLGERWATLSTTTALQRGNADDPHHCHAVFPPPRLPAKVGYKQQAAISEGTPDFRGLQGDPLATDLVARMVPRDPARRLKMASTVQCSSWRHSALDPLPRSPA